MKVTTKKMSDTDLKRSLRSFVEGVCKGITHLKDLLKLLLGLTHGLFLFQ